MNCKDCLHYKICEAFNARETFATMHCAEECPGFTANSEWVHLPCKVGTPMFFLRDQNIIETSVEKIIFKGNGCYIKLKCNAMYETSCQSIGKTVFFTRESAEKALAERGMK